MRSVLVGTALCFASFAQGLSVTSTHGAEEKDALRGLRGVVSPGQAASAEAHRGLTEATLSKEELKVLRAEAAAKREAAKKERERAKAEHSAHKHNKVFLPGTKTDHKHHKHHTKDDFPEPEEEATDLEAKSSAQIEADEATATYREAKSIVKGHGDHHKKNKSLLNKVASVLPGHSKKDDKKSSAKAAAAAVGDDGSLVSFIAPSVGDRVTLMMRSKALSNVDGVVMVADPSTHLYNIKLDDGRDVKKAKLGGIHAPPPVGTEVLTRGFKAELNNLRGKVTALDSVAWQATLLLEDGRTLRRVKWTNMLFLPPNGARVLTRGLKQEMSGLPGVVLATDTAKWQVQVQLDSDPRPKWLPPGKLEMDLVRE